MDKQKAVEELPGAPENSTLNAPSIRLSLKRRIFGAGAWSLTGFALTYAIRLGSSLLTTRLLVPQMFGVMAIAQLVITGLSMFSDLGLKQNIVQSKRGSDADYLNTAWTVQIIRGMLLWLLVLCVSLLIFAANRLGFVPKSSGYSDPSLPYVVAVASVSTIISGLQSTKFLEASRHLALARITLIQIAAQVIGLICMIGWILIDRSIWALVAGAICSSVVMTMLSHTWLPGVPNRWHWDQSAFHDIFHFGKWIFLSSLLGFAAANADRIFLGGLVDIKTLGIYSIAFTIYSAIALVLNVLIADVSFSAFSELVRERQSELKRNLYRFHFVMASAAYFCGGLVIVDGGTLIRLLYDPRYEDAGWMLQILGVGLLAVPFGLAQSTLLARGMPRMFTNVIAIRVAVTVVVIPLGFHWFGLSGALWGIVSGQLSMAPLMIYYQIKHGLFDSYRELLPLPMLLAGMIVGQGFNLAIGR
jgi:O-antigen/teichoic acid export membrane protein